MYSRQSTVTKREHVSDPRPAILKAGNLVPQFRTLNSQIAQNNYFFPHNLFKLLSIYINYSMYEFEKNL